MIRSMIMQDGLFRFTILLSLNNLLVQKELQLLFRVIKPNTQYGHWLKINIATIFIQLIMKNQEEEGIFCGYYGCFQAYLVGVVSSSVFVESHMPLFQLVLRQQHLQTMDGVLVQFYHLVLRQQHLQTMDGVHTNLFLLFLIMEEN